MDFQYKIILPRTTQNIQVLTETIDSVLAQLTEETTKYGEVILGSNYETLDWKEGIRFPDTSSLIAAKTLPGAGSFACFNVENDRPIYKHLESEDIIPEVSP